MKVLYHTVLRRGVEDLVAYIAEKWNNPFRETGILFDAAGRGCQRSALGDNLCAIPLT